MILLTLLAICSYRTMTVAVVADITPRPLRTKADSIEKIVGYAGTGVMLVAITLLVPNSRASGLSAAFRLAGSVHLRLGASVLLAHPRAPAC